ncbi:MAG: translation initiation factor IF-2 [Dehalococcoidia bacterium]|nr:translation initiation factor IF-2 [Dehalococcoidia bacterium]
MTTTNISQPTQSTTTSLEHSLEEISTAIRLQGLEPLSIPAAVTVADFAAAMDVGPVEVIKALMRTGYMFTINDVIEHGVASVVSPAFGYGLLPLEAESSSETGSTSLVFSPDEEDDQEALAQRPPVITILGHVDHGKTTLLDTIRNANVVEGEAGGITQHMGAYQIEREGTLITFLDTPGHEAFTAMRARGAQVTDIAVLIVAADDGIMPQTIEAIDHARAAEVPIVIAINKIDLPNADQERVKRQLAEQNLLIEEWGGEIIAVPVSAINGEGVDELLENLIVLSEVSELRANPDRYALGVVVEARRDRSRGTVATLIVQTGTLEIGDNIVIGGIRGKIRAMFDDGGNRIDSAGPSTPVEILGLSALPEAGELFEVAADEREARDWVQDYEIEQRRERQSGPTLEDVHTRIQLGEIVALNLIVKTDVQGTLEPVRAALERLNSDSARVNIVHIASGGITESDILLAVASKAIIIGFNSPPEQGAQILANQEGVEIRNYDVIYHMTEDVERALTGMLQPVYEEVFEGRATVRAVFNLGRRARVAGIYVNDGRITRGNTLRVMRNGNVIATGVPASLKRFQDDVREIANGFEGGVTIEGFSDWREEDVIESYRSVQVR